MPSSITPVTTSGGGSSKACTGWLASWDAGGFGCPPELEALDALGRFFTVIDVLEELLAGENGEKPRRACSSGPAAMRKSAARAGPPPTSAGLHRAPAGRRHARRTPAPCPEPRVSQFDQHRQPLRVLAVVDEIRQSCPLVVAGRRAGRRRAWRSAIPSSVHGHSASASVPQPTERVGKLRPCSLAAMELAYPEGAGLRFAVAWQSYSSRQSKSKAWG